VNALWKLVIVLTNGDETDSVKQRLEGAQTQIFVRLTIGAMQEAWTHMLSWTQNWLGGDSESIERHTNRETHLVKTDSHKVHYAKIHAV
jgi:hypothetical protein